VSVRLCHKSEFYRNGCTDRAGFLHSVYPPLISYTVSQENSCIFKNKGTSLWKVVPNSELNQFFCFFTTARRSSQVLINFYLCDRRPSPVYYAGRPPLFTTPSAWTHGVARFVCDSWDLCLYRSNSICLICCGFVMHVQAVQQNPQGIRNKSKQVWISICCGLVAAPQPNTTRTHQEMR